MNPTPFLYDPATDVVDHAAALAPNGPTYAVRHARDKVAAATQGSYAALFDPALPGGLSLAERLLVALHACRLTPAPELAAHYALRLREADIDAAQVDAPATPRLKAILDFTRTLIARPVEGDRAALLALPAAGLSTQAVVTLAQLIAFLSYQTRLVAGLKAMQALHAQPGGVADRPTQPLRATQAPPLGSLVESHGFTNATLGWKAWLDVVDVATASPEQIAVLEESHPKAKVSDYYLFLVHQPEILRQRSTAFNAIMYAPGGLSRAERELGATVVSRINGCVYCGSVHAQRFEQLAKRNDVIAQVFDEPRGAGTSAREQAITDFSIKLTEAPDTVVGADIRALQSAGLAEAETLDLLHAVAIFAWANRLMLNLGEPVQAPAPA
jgi:CMD domain protein